ARHSPAGSCSSRPASCSPAFSSLGRDTTAVAEANRMIFLGFGKYARAHKIYAIEPIRDDRRGHGRRTLVWVEGVNEAIVASRTEGKILADSGQDPGLSK